MTSKPPKDTYKTGFVRDCAGNQRLATAWWAVEKDASGRLHTQRLEESWVPQRELDHLSDLSHCLFAAADIIVAHVVKLLFIFALDRLALAVDHCIGRTDNEFTRLHTNNGQSIGDKYAINWQSTENPYFM